VSKNRPPLANGLIRGAVLGGNVSKSRSPAIHLAAFAALGVTGRYDRHSVDEAGFDALVGELGAAGFDYLNVTIPHKAAAAALADAASPLVKKMAAANTLIFQRRAGKLRVRAENTDGYGLMTALADAGVRPARGSTVVLLGSGGAAAGGLAALVATGARIRLVARRPAVARALRRRFPANAQARIEVVPWRPAALAQAIAGAAALISSVPADAFATPEATAGLEDLEASTAVLEMAYGQATPLAAFVKARPRTKRPPYQDGLPMLVHQAARTVELVLGKLPPTEPLMRAAKRVPRVTAAAAVRVPRAGEPASMMRGR
jgi:shikimate dehydrogenase